MKMLKLLFLFIFFFHLKGSCQKINYPNHPIDSLCEVESIVAAKRLNDSCMISLSIGSKKSFTVPASVEKIKNLVYLIIKAKGEIVLPNHMNSLSNLEMLILNGYITERTLNTSLRGCKYLGGLQLEAKNNLLHLPSVIFQLKHLKSFSMISNQSQSQKLYADLVSLVKTTTAKSLQVTLQLSKVQKKLLYATAMKRNISLQIFNPS